MHSKSLIIRISDNAADNLREIYGYTAQEWEAAQADRYYDLLDGSFQKLAQNPALGCRRDTLPPQFLSYAMGMHAVIYQHDKKHLDIHAIFHQHMDIPARLAALLLTYH